MSQVGVPTGKFSARSTAALFIPHSENGGLPVIAMVS